MADNAEAEPGHPAADVAGADGVALVRASTPDEGWVVVAGSDRRVRINGYAVDTGIRVLRDRDELGVDGRERMYFSTEMLAHVEPLPPFDRPIVCPRCMQPIGAGDLAVACPGCRVWHHQSDEYPCWTYAARCAGCGDQDTDLEAGFRWSPNEL